MKRLLLRSLLIVLSLVLAIGIAELAYRVFGPEEGRVRYEQYFEDAGRQRTDVAAAIARGDVIVGDLPRNRARWARAHTFYICYRDNPRAALDERHCTRADINRFGIRDSQEVTYEKPPGEWRLVCLGDSFTFGWGVNEPDTWVRQIETKLRPKALLRGVGLRAINCGASGTLLVDEYWWALRDRFHEFNPDMVLATICLNDLVPMPNVLAWQRPATRLPGQGVLRLIGAAAAMLTESSRLSLDPEVDWGRLLLQLPDREEAARALDDDTVQALVRAVGVRAEASPADMRRFLVAYTNKLYADVGTPGDAIWKNGGPQAALRAMRDWCAERGVRFGVVVWPLFQGIESAETYPFHTLHRVVADFCEEEGIPHLDLLETFVGRPSASLWCDPSDLHANELAHRLASEPIARFVARTGGLPR